MTLFKNPAERQQWINGRCHTVGQRFVAEYWRLGLTPDTVPYDCAVDLEAVTRYPHMASNLRAGWLAVAASYGLDVQFVLLGQPAPSVTQAPIVPPMSRPGSGGAAERSAWERALHVGIGTRLNEECGRLALDLAPIDYLCSRSAQELQDCPGKSGAVKADFLSLLAERGVCVQYVLTGHRS